MSREGQLDSQKPHSMQRSTIELAGGLGFRCLMCTSGSCSMPPKQPIKRVRLTSPAHLDSLYRQAMVPPKKALHLTIMEVAGTGTGDSPR